MSLSIFSGKNQYFRFLRLQWSQSCYLLPKFGSSPEFGVFQEIAQKIAQKILCYFKIGQKSPKKLPKGWKSSRNSTEVLHICQNHPKKLPKSSRFFEKYYKTFSLLSKVPKKAPEFWRDFNLVTALRWAAQVLKLDNTS